MKAGGEVVVNILVKLFNHNIETEIRPKDWSRMIVTPIYKKEIGQCQQIIESYFSYHFQAKFSTNSHGKNVRS